MSEVHSLSDSRVLAGEEPGRCMQRGGDEGPRGERRGQRTKGR